jgi:hypothetical protein
VEPWRYKNVRDGMAWYIRNLILRGQPRSQGHVCGDISRTMLVLEDILSINVSHLALSILALRSVTRPSGACWTNASRIFLGNTKTLQ